MQQLIQKNEAEYCGKVPLHQTNLVQPHGYLLVVQQDTLQIVQVGENVSDLLGMAPADIVRTTLHQHLPAAEIEALKAGAAGATARLPFLFSFGAAQYLGTLRRQDQSLIIELEKTPRPAGGTDGFFTVYGALRYAMVAIEAASNMEELATVVVREIKRISGFDKVMLYRFDEHWNGDVIAEEMEEGMDSYLGLKFPASDVPKQARELYQKTAFRLIPDVNYAPVRLYPIINPLTNALTNLSDSNLRSVAAVHLEYLRNMKVAASMSTRVLHNNELWGLIACHHRTPRFLSFEMCGIFELLSYVISSRVASLLNAGSLQFFADKNSLQAKIIQQVYQQDDVAAGLNKSKRELAELLQADGIAITVNGKMYTYGKVPPAMEIEELVMWLQAVDGAQVFHQSSLSSVYEQAETFAETSSGLLALPVQPDRGSYILAFRPEKLAEVSWGGNPEEAVQLEGNGIKYHPRASFDIWKQTVRKTAERWTADEQRVAEQLRNFVVDFTLKKI